MGAMLAILADGLFEPYVWGFACIFVRFLIQLSCCCMIVVNVGSSRGLQVDIRCIAASRWSFFAQ